MGSVTSTSTTPSSQAAMIARRRRMEDQAATDTPKPTPAQAPPVSVKAPPKATGETSHNAHLCASHEPSTTQLRANLESKISPKGQGSQASYTEHGRYTRAPDAVAIGPNVPLAEGMSGPRVEEYQRELSAKLRKHNEDPAKLLGTDENKDGIDGFYGPKTAAAKKRLDELEAQAGAPKLDAGLGEPSTTAVDPKKLVPGTPEAIAYGRDLEAQRVAVTKQIKALEGSNDSTSNAIRAERLADVRQRVTDLHGSEPYKLVQQYQNAQRELKALEGTRSLAPTVGELDRWRAELDTKRQAVAKLEEQATPHLSVLDEQKQLTKMVDALRIGRGTKSVFASEIAELKAQAKELESDPLRTIYSVRNEQYQRQAKELEALRDQRLFNPSVADVDAHISKLRALEVSLEQFQGYQ